MRRVFLLLLAALSVLPLSSCLRALERARQNIRVEGVEHFAMQGLTGAEATLRVVNGTGRRLVLDEARMDLYYGGSRAGTAVLRERVEVERRTTADVATRWRLKISDPLAAYALSRALRGGDLSPVRVSYAVEGRGGPVPVKISGQMVPLSEFLNIFGLTLQDVKNYLK